MDIILDSNIIFSDPKLSGSRFESLFDYLRRVGSTLIVPRVVYEEVCSRLLERIGREVNELNEAIETLERSSSLVISRKVEFQSEKELGAFQERLRHPSPKVNVLVQDSYDGIDVGEIVRRGVNRIRPASSDGEQLRDVVLWLSVLGYAASTGAPIAFVSDDKTFVDSEGALHPDLKGDIEQRGLTVSFHRGLQSFIRENSPAARELSESEAWEIAPENTLRDWVLQRVRAGAWTYEITDLEYRDVAFKSGKIYEVSPNSQFAEIEVEVIFTVVAERYRWPHLLHGVDAVYKNGTNLILVQAKHSIPPATKAQVSEYTALRDPIEEVIAECDFGVKLSARLVDGKVSELDPDRVWLAHSSNASFGPVTRDME